MRQTAASKLLSSRLFAPGSLVFLAADLSLTGKDFRHGGVRIADNLYEQAVFFGFKMLEMMILGPILLIWLIAYVLLQIYKKKGRDYAAFRDLFHLLDAGLIMAGALYLILYVASYNLERIAMDSARSFSYPAVIFYTVGAATVILYLWIISGFVSYAKKTRYGKTTPIITDIRKDKKIVR